MFISGRFPFFFLVALLLGSCDSDDAPEFNEGPTTPIPQNPANYSQLHGNSVLFSWDPATDPEGEEVSYNLQVSLNADFTQVIFSNAVHSASYELQLPGSGYYYWRIRAKDASNNSTEFSRRQNFNIAENNIVNYAPFPPERRFPELDAGVDLSQVELGWSAVDLDDTDLSYNIYVGTSYGLQTLYVENIKEDRVTLNLDPSEVYYWKVEAKDPYGNMAESPVWWFKSN